MKRGFLELETVNFSERFRLLVFNFGETDLGFEVRRSETLFLEILG